MDINQKLNRISRLITQPKLAWKQIQKDKLGSAQLFRGLFLPAVILLGLAEMLGMLISTINTGPASYVFIFSILIVFALLLSYFLSIFLNKRILQYLEFSGPLHVVDNLTAYSLIIGYLPIMISGLFRSMLFINVLALYGFYVYYIGINYLLRMNHGRRQQFAIVSVIVLLGVHLLVFILVFSLKDWLLELF